MRWGFERGVLGWEILGCIDDSVFGVKTIIYLAIDIIVGMTIDSAGSRPHMVVG